MDVRDHDLDALLGRSLLTAEAFASELRRRIVEEAADMRGLFGGAFVLDAARELLAEYEPIAVQAMTDAEVAAWVMGVDSVAAILPDSAEEFLAGSSLPPPRPPGAITEILGGGGEPVIRLPLIEQAAEQLLERDIVTRPVFDQLTASARSRAFTVAFQDSEDVISTIRDTLAETIQEGASLGEFRNRLDEAIGSSRLGPAHLENVYRTNIQSAFHRGHDDLASNPIVEDVFPYQEYLPINDVRVREEHLALGSLGLSGTGVYRRDDPMWDLFTPPWGYQCRCGVNLLTIEAAARKGVQEAQRWLRTGQPPAFPEWRLDDIPFRPEDGFVGARRAA